VSALDLLISQREHDMEKNAFNMAL